MRANRLLGRASHQVSSATERLSSGQRISRANDDAAGLAIASSLGSSSRIYSTAVRNVNDGISYLSIADGAVTSLKQVLTRLAELAEQGSNGTYSSQQRAALDREASSLQNEYNRIVE